MPRLLLVGLLLLQGALAANAKPLQLSYTGQPLPSSNLAGPRRTGIIPATANEPAIGSVNRPRRMAPGMVSNTSTADVGAETGIAKP